MKTCNSCGKCCESAGNGGLSATADEIRWWQAHRPEIARYARNGKIWVDPETGEYLARCPWLKVVAGARRTRCEIYADRPEDCRHYPVDIAQMQRHDCEMLEPKDLANTGRAQRALDQIMIDVRPAAGTRFNGS